MTWIISVDIYHRKETKDFGKDKKNKIDTNIKLIQE